MQRPTSTTRQARGATIVHPPWNSSTKGKTTLSTSPSPRRTTPQPSQRIHPKSTAVDSKESAATQVDPLLIASQHAFSSDSLLEAFYSPSSTLENIARQLSTFDASIGPVVPSWAESQCCTSSLEDDVDAHLHQFRLRIAVAREKLESQQEGALPKMLRQRKSDSGLIMKILSVESPRTKTINQNYKSPQADTMDSLVAEWRPPTLNVSFPVEESQRQSDRERSSADDSTRAAAPIDVKHNSHRYDLLRSTDAAGKAPLQSRPIVQGSAANTERQGEPLKKRLEQPKQHLTPTDQTSTMRRAPAFDKREYVTQILSRKSNLEADGPLVSSPQRRRLSPPPSKKPPVAHDHKKVLMSPDVRREARHQVKLTLMSPPPEAREAAQKNTYMDDNDDVWFDRDVRGTQDYEVLRELRMEPIEHVHHQSIDESEIVGTDASQATSTKPIEAIRIAPRTIPAQDSVASFTQPDVTARRSVSQAVLSSSMSQSNALFPVMAANDVMTRALCAANFFGTSFAMPPSAGEKQTIRSLSVDELLSQYA